MGTIEQHSKIDELKTKGYSWNKRLSTAYCAVVLSNSKDDIWVFGLDGSISHNPDRTNVLA